MCLTPHFFMGIDAIKTINDAKKYFDEHDNYDAIIYEKERPDIDRYDNDHFHHQIKNLRQPLTILYEVHAVMEAIAKYHNSGVKDLLDRYDVRPIDEDEQSWQGTISYTTAMDVSIISLFALENGNADYHVEGYDDKKSIRYDIHEINKFFRKILKDVEPTETPTEKRAQEKFWRDVRAA